MRFSLGFLLFALASPTHAAEPTADNCWSMPGVWEYVAPSWPGRTILARQGNKCVGVFFVRDPQAATTDPTTDTEKAAAYSSAAGGAWEYTCERLKANLLRCKNRTLFSMRPSEVGSDMTLEVELDGDDVKWWVLGRDEKRGEPGAARRLR